METKLKMYGIVDENDKTYYMSAKDEKEAFWIYMNYLYCYESRLKKADSVLTLEELIFLFNEYNHKNYKIKALFSVDCWFFGDVEIKHIGKEGYSE